MIATTHSDLLLHSIYNMLHTIYSSNIFQIRRILCTFVAPLYSQFQTIYSSQTISPAGKHALHELQSLYFALCGDSRLLIRREAVLHFSDCFSVFGHESITTFYKQLLTFLRDEVCTLYSFSLVLILFHSLVICRIPLN